MNPWKPYNVGMTSKNYPWIKITQFIMKGVYNMAKKSSVNDHQKANKIILEPKKLEKINKEIEEFERNKFGEKILENLISEYKS